MMRFKYKDIYKFIADKYSNVKLRKKIIISFVIIVAIPILVVSFFLFYNIEEYLKNSTIKNHKYQLDIEHDKMINNVSIIGNISQVVTNNEDIIRFISDTNEMENYEFYKLSTSVYKYLSNLQNNNQYISTINIFPENNQVNEIWPFIYNKDRINKENWYNEISNGNEEAMWNLYYYDDDISIYFYAGQKDRNLVVSLNSKIIDSENNNLGILRIAMKVEDFLPMMEKKSLNKYNSVYIYNVESEKISGEEALPGNIELNTYREEFFESIKENLVGGAGEFEYNKFKEKMVVLYKKAPISNCYIVDVISLNSLTEQISKLKIYTIIGTSIVIIILILVIWGITDIILKRLYLIIDSLKEIEDGNFNTNIPVYGYDEIGLLAHNFRKMMKKINLLINEGIRKEMATKDAELKALKTQIDAHFLYNTLENIKMMAEVEANYMVADSLSALGDLMRYNTKWSNEYVMLNEELVHIKNYISLMGLRYDYNINLHINVNSELKYMSILKMIIQPLVENAVKHGIAKELKYRDGNIYINVNREKEFIIIEVIDDGVGMIEEQRILLDHHINDTSSDKYGLGLKNVYERVKLSYGNNSSITVESQLEKGTKLILSIPK